MKVYILDSTAILSGKPLLFDGEIITVSSVEKEVIKKGEGERIAFLKGKGLKTYHPSKESLEFIEKLAREKGENTRLSPADKELLALALDFKREKETILVTDDYSIQNMADFLNIKYLGLMEKGISKRFVWMYKCNGCGKVFKNHLARCPVCGSRLKTIVKKASPLGDK
ncbi:MAG: NOB1 family endonuclease [Thermoplasmata archaeon]|nr:NOB1 family endonuclease [Thermoplasmata archaeon]